MNKFGIAGQTSISESLENYTVIFRKSLLKPSVIEVSTACNFYISNRNPIFILNYRSF